MKNVKKWLTFVLMVIFCLSLVACSKNESNNTLDNNTDSNNISSNVTPVELQEFTPTSGIFSISVPEIEGGWKIADNLNDGFLAIDNSDESFTIMVQCFPKEALLTDLNGIIAYYQENMLNELNEEADEEINISNTLSVQAKSYSGTRYNSTGKALVAFIETEKCYYVYMISGAENVYDANIDVQRAAISNFTENI